MHTATSMPMNSASRLRSMGLTARERNPFTGLQTRARYYAPQNGGFITQDSFSGVLDDALTQNRYTYAGNNPVNNIDPSGHRYVKGIEIGDNLKSSSAKKQPTTSGRPVRRVLS